MANASAEVGVSDELRRTQKYLAEVIDECVFVERQRDLTERRLSSQLATHKALVDDLTIVLRNLCRYTSQIESAALPALLTALPPSSSAHEHLLRLRGDVCDALARLQQRSGGDHDEDARLATPPRVSHGARPSAVSGSSDEAVAAGAQVMHAILAHKTRLVDALCIAAASAEAVRATTTAATADSSDVEVLRTRMDELTRRLETGTGAGASPTPAAASTNTATATAGVAVAASAETSPSATRFAQARELAFEKTVQALNSELAVLHENYAALSRASTREMESMKQRLADTQHKHEDQIAECDAVLGRLSLELEQLIHENAQLKHKLRSVTELE
ncbi:hypothetical protein NESM_000799200 [Novymonas esmeraldas]|uniref:Uncharacterized protein n=1 Tax=Novymonas esmeraldas TaxID=1808958 RepID=A0AAW0EXZ8_9TRYP